MVVDKSKRWMTQDQKKWKPEEIEKIEKAKEEQRRREQEQNKQQEENKKGKG